MNLLQRLTLASLACNLLAISPVIADAIQPFKASYEISNGEYTVGNATLLLEEDANSWTMQLATEPTGVFKLMSRGYTTESSVISKQAKPQSQQLLPLRYSYQQKKGKPERNLQAEFIAEAKLVSVVTQAGEESVLQTNGSAHDPLSSMLETMCQLRVGANGTITLDVFSRGDVKTHKLEIGSKETIATSKGEHSTVPVTRTHSGSARETRIWYASSLNYIPVRIEQHKRGKLVARLSLTTVSQ